MMNTFTPINVNINNAGKIKIKVDFTRLWQARINNNNEIGIRNKNTDEIGIFTIVGLENINDSTIYAIVDFENGVFEIVKAPVQNEPINYADYRKQVFMDVFGFDPDADEKTQMAQIMESLGYKQPKKKVVRTPFGNVYVNE